MAVVTVDGTNYDLTDGLVSNANEFTFQNLADAYGNTLLLEEFVYDGEVLWTTKDVE